MSKMRYCYLPRSANCGSINPAKMILPSKLAAVSHDAGTNSDTPSLDDLIPLREAAKLSGLSAGHLCLTVREGHLWGVKLGQKWVTTIQVVEECLDRDRRAGPRPKKPRGYCFCLRHSQVVSEMVRKGSRADDVDAALRAVGVHRV